MPSRAKSSRIATFDILRGYFLFVIMVDHLMRSFGFWELFTGRGAQWVSAAEGFFFVSGIMIGIVRGSKMIGQPIKAVFKKCWSRAALLYVWSIGLTALFSLLALILAGNSGLKADYFSGSLFDFAIQTLSMQFSYGWADFLNFYALYLFFAPLAIWLLRKGLWHSVIIISLICWMLTTTMFGGWQIIFYSGLVLGFYKEQLEQSFARQKPAIKKVIKWSICLAALASLIASIFFTTIAEEYGKVAGGGIFGFDLSGAASYSINTLRPIFDKVAMQPARLGLFYIWFTALYIVVNKFEVQIKKYLGWFLVTLGQNSLYVYIVSAILLFILNLLIPMGQPWPVNILITTSFLGLVWYMTKKRFLFNLIPS